MISIINEAWQWLGFKVIEVLQTNDFGNVIFKTDKNEFWRICPEDISCEKIADSEKEFINIFNDLINSEDWMMTNIINIAKSKLGELEVNQKYCLKTASVFGGKYEKANIGKINFEELILFSGEIGFQIKDMKDGEKIELKVI